MLKKGLETSYEDSNRCKHSKPANQNANPKCKGIGELTLLDFLEQAEGKNQNLADKQIALAGGGTLKFTILTCLLYTSDAADEEDSVEFSSRRTIKKKKKS